LIGKEYLKTRISGIYLDKNDYRLNNSKYNRWKANNFLLSKTG
jgi:hypothetical protein